MHQHLVPAALFHHAPVLHDHDPVSDFRHHSEVMGYKQHSGAPAFLHFLNQRQDLCLRGHVERCGRFVGDQQSRVKH